MLPLFPSDYDLPNATYSNTVYQLFANVTIPSGISPCKLYDDAVETFLDWLETQVPFFIPREEGRRKGFRCYKPKPNFSGLYCSSHPEVGQFAVLLVHGDKKTGHYDATPARHWIINAALRRVNDEVLFGISVVCVYVPAIEGEYAPHPCYFPGLVKEMIGRHGLFDAHPIGDKPWYLESENDLNRLCELLVSKKRDLPVVVLTQNGIREGSFSYDEQKLLQDALGYAHVVCLPPALEHRWTEMVGSDWSVPPDSVLAYEPGINFQNGSAKKGILYSFTLTSLEKEHESEYRYYYDFLLSNLENQMWRDECWGLLQKYPKVRFRKARKDRVRVQSEIKDLCARIDAKGSPSIQDNDELRICLKRLEEVCMEEVSAARGLLYEKQIEKDEMELTYETKMEILRDAHFVASKDNEELRKMIRDDRENARKLLASLSLVSAENLD